MDDDNKPLTIFTCKHMVKIEFGQWNEAWSWIHAYEGGRYVPSSVRNADRLSYSYVFMFNDTEMWTAFKLRFS